MDSVRGVFFTNLEDKGTTLAFDVKTRKPLSTWNPGCNSDGPRGLAIDVARQIPVACPDRLVSLLVTHNGAKAAELPVGDGVDNIDYLPSRQEVFVAASIAETLTIVHLGPQGELEVSARTATAKGTRVVIATKGRHTAFVADSYGKRLIMAKRPSASGALKKTAQ